LNVRIRSGEVVGLIGENGCGKSTLLKLMTRIMYPDSGSITVRGRVSSLLELGAGFHPDLTGRENIYTNAAIFGLSKKEIDGRLQDIIEFSELYESIDNPVRTYSSGMYMRLAFSVAINVNADILLIDEILAVGDTNFQEKCFNKLEQLKSEGITIVLVSHDSSVVQRFCMRAIWIQDGKIAFDGDADSTVDAYNRYMNKKKIEEFNNGRDYEIDDIKDAYRFFLKREPENQQVILQQYNYFRHIKDLIEMILDSEEFAVQAEANDWARLGTNEIIRAFSNYMKKEKGKTFPLGLKSEEKEDRDVACQKDIYLKQAYVDGYGQENKVELLPFDKVDIVIDYAICKKPKDVALGLVCNIYYSDGTLCYSSSTRREEFVLDHKEGEDAAIFSINSLPLMNGVYHLDVRLEDDKGRLMDQLSNCIQFVVASSDKSVGMVNMQHSWTERHAETKA
jgi:ABC-type polysaccharide/polyol phosphate transport system ATPase subunit